jgi:8-oxo-dGTP pyrophosphatase MutT (NUDIX family)
LIRAAGGVVVRDGLVLVVHRQRYDDWSLPKGKLEPGETWEDAALREVREETGLEATPVEKLGDIKYWYARDGDRVMKIVSFFLFRYRSGRLEDHDHEVEEALWIPLEEAPERLAYRSEKDIAETALSRVTQGS